MTLGSGIIVLWNILCTEPNVNLCQISVILVIYCAALDQAWLKIRACVPEYYTKIICYCPSDTEKWDKCKGKITQWSQYRALITYILYYTTFYSIWFLLLVWVSPTPHRFVRLFSPPNDAVCTFAWSVFILMFILFIMTLLNLQQ